MVWLLVIPMPLVGIARHALVLLQSELGLTLELLMQVPLASTLEQPISKDTPV